MRRQEINYGELVVLGTDGELPGGNKGRRRSRYTLRRRPKPNGVTPTGQQTFDLSCTSPQLINQSQLRNHTVTYTLNRQTQVVVKYEHDETKDLFQIGRSTDPPIDMVLIDIQPGASAKAGSRTVLPEQSTISRFSCRIVCDREPPYVARIYAAGFDSKNRIFLGEKAPKWDMNGTMDGLTTNGVLIHHIDDQNLTWRELSVGGSVFSLRETRSDQKRGEFCPEFDNVLRDGTLIDLCGVTLLWRSEKSVLNMPKDQDIDNALDRLNSIRVQCPVGLSTLKFSGHKTNDQRQPYCYMKCGHVQGPCDWGQKLDQKKQLVKECPLCRQESQKVVALVQGKEAAFHIDSEEPGFTFNPCGHIVSLATAKYWSQHKLPKGTQEFISRCPFCAIPVDPARPYVKLICQNLEPSRDDSVSG
ncbi:Oidioi.mRNA.OKI2018_I69.chr1.g2594.t1.cds [Oikopleura dioica]|uniref:Oidioi.mRNA.OKI2018_I69.chr1.g2594.t1.cds n=1 Tax=Oikopleura dioica TaxID=34765 RepID=A0ABN7SXY4_OIKDI|nr:Oidioi.mRNA.OKI2018_I69.chr1.g2594.t1.cds [Oikopleura dioica]